jgi:hypothetical protein
MRGLLPVAIAFAAVALSCRNSHMELADAGAKPADATATADATAGPAQPVTTAPEPPHVGAETFEPIARQTTKVSIHRHSCIPGGCPVYDLDIYENGSVQYYGVSCVSQSGPKVGHAAAPAVETLVRRLVDEGYFSLTWAPCVPNVNDGLGGVDVTLEYRGRRWRRTHSFKDECAPAVLLELEHEIDRIAGSLVWVGSNGNGACGGSVP